MKIKQPRTFTELKADPRVRDAWKERGEDNGMETWIGLNKGWKSGDDPVGVLHTIHEKTINEACRQVHEALPCQCDECLEDYPTTDIPCDCGNPNASWHGPTNGRREYLCDGCYAISPTREEGY